MSYLADEWHYSHAIRINVAGLRLRRKIYLLLHADEHISPSLRNFKELLCPFMLNVVGR